MHAEEARRVITAAFPSPASFKKFLEDAPGHVGSAAAFARYARKNGLIEQDTPEAFGLLLASFSTVPADIPVVSMTFEKLVDELRGKRSNKNLVDNLNTLAASFKMKAVHASMLTRLRKNFRPNTAGKRQLARLLAMLAANKRPDLKLDFDRIIAIGSGDRAAIAAEMPKEGVRLIIALRGRGDSNESNFPEWTRNEFGECVKDLRLGHLAGLRDAIVSYDSATSFVDLPKRKGPEDDPRLYDAAIRDAIAISYQLNTRWLLSDLNKSRNRHLVLGIGAGPFISMPEDLRLMVEEEIPGDPFCRLTDFASLCARLADIRATFDSFSLRIGGGRLSRAWFLRHAWSAYFHDFAPQLLKPEMLPVTSEDYEQFRAAIFNPIQQGRDRKDFQILRRLRACPDNVHLALEVCKVLMARRMFHEADAILTPVLVYQPFHVVCRVTRLMIYFLQAAHAGDFSLSERHFQKAMMESRYIESYCDVTEEEYWCELGIGQVGRAVRLYREWRRQKDEAEAGETFREEIIASLTLAEQSFLAGVGRSPTGHRSNYWLVHARGFRRLLEKEGLAGLQDDGAGAMIVSRQGDKEDAYCQVAAEAFQVMGWIRENHHEMKPEEALAELSGRLLPAMDAFRNAVLNRSFAANIHFALATILTDFLPALPEGHGAMVIDFLNRACEEAKAIEKNGVGIFSNTQFQMTVQSPAQFAEFCRIARDKVKKYFAKRDESAGLKLMLYFLDTPAEQGEICVPPPVTGAHYSLELQSTRR